MAPRLVNSPRGCLPGPPDRRNTCRRASTSSARFSIARRLYRSLPGGRRQRAAAEPLPCRLHSHPDIQTTIDMTSKESSLTAQAETLLASRFARLREPTVKMASFRTGSGRQLGLARERTDVIHLWAEHFEPGLAGIEVNNRKRPGLPYGPDQSRSTAVNTHCNQMRAGNQAWYLRCDTLVSFERFLDWYSSQ
jgi:hypothetical protein